MTVNKKSAFKILIILLRSFSATPFIALIIDSSVFARLINTIEGKYGR